MGRKSEYVSQTEDFHLTREMRELRARWESGLGKRRAKSDPPQSTRDVHAHFKWLEDRVKILPYPALLATVAKLEVLGLHRITCKPHNLKSRTGYAWLKQIAASTGDRTFEDAARLLKDLKLAGSDWQKYERRWALAIWGDSDGDAFREHFEAEKVISRRKREGTNGRGCKDRLAIARVVTRIGYKAASFESAIKRGYALRNRPKPTSEPSFGWLCIRVPHGALIRDPHRNFRIVAPGNFRLVRNSLYWQRRVRDGDVVLIHAIHRSTIPKT